MALKRLKAVWIIWPALLAFFGGMKYGPELYKLWWNGLENGDGPVAPGDKPGDRPGEKPGENPDDAEYARLIELVGAAAAVNRTTPVNAVFSKVYQTVIPELNGYEIDIESTAARLAAAFPGQAVTPVWREIAPAITLNSYPAAVIERGNPARPQVSLMINVAWGNEFLPEMLSLLEQHGVHTTFFPVGRWAESYPELLMQIYHRGHELGNHGYADWEVMSDLDYGGAVESLRKTNRVIAGLTGQEPRYFTPHQGAYNSATREAAASLRMRLLLWTLDTVDWQRPGEEEMARRILDGLVPGAIILMHPTEQSAGFLRRVLPEIRARGYEIVPVSELLSPSPAFPAITLQR